MTETETVTTEHGTAHLKPSTFQTWVGDDDERPPMPWEVSGPRGDCVAYITDEADGGGVRWELRHDFTTQFIHALEDSGWDTARWIGSTEDDEGQPVASWLAPQVTAPTREAAARKIMDIMDALGHSYFKSS